MHRHKSGFFFDLEQSLATEIPLLSLATEIPLLTGVRYDVPGLCGGSIIRQVLSQYQRATDDAPSAEVTAVFDRRRHVAYLQLVEWGCCEKEHRKVKT
jgi:hypothetical protein